MKKKIFQFIKRALTRSGYSIKQISPKKETILLNVFESDFKKRVLISYLLQPFTEEMISHHTNYLECYTAAEIFHELGYVVDVVDLFDDATEIDFENYKIVYGLGHPLEKAFYSKKPEELIKILYSTGCNPFYSFRASVLQVQSFYHSKGILIPESSRVIDSFWTFQYLLSDYVVALGNQFVANTYLEANPLIKCSHVSAFYFDVYDINMDSKDFENARSNFLWFGSSGLLHKGLDLLIDIFSNRDDINLHICGHTKNETKFWDHYRPITEKCRNIIDHGHIDILSNSFKILMDDCAFCIFPTASEGGSPSLINVMANGGLIPIASEACGIEIGSIGYQFEVLSKESIMRIIENVQLLSSDRLREKSKIVKDFIRRTHSYDKYKVNMNKTIITAIKLFKAPAFEKV